MLGHLAPAQHAADPQADFVTALQRVVGPRHRGLNTGQVFLSSGQQLFAFARPFVGQRWVAANHQTFVGIIRTADLGHVGCVKQRGLQRTTVLGKGLNVWRA